MTVGNVELVFLPGTVNAEASGPNPRLDCEEPTVPD
jgi:hypothetical protein